MRRVFTVLALFAPSIFLVVLSLQPQADTVVRLPLFHFYIVTLITFTAAVISILLSTTLGHVARPRHVLAAVACAAIASIFFLHGIATPGALIDYSHPAVRWSAWLTLFGGGFVFALAGLDGLTGLPRWLPLRRIIFIVTVGVILYLGVAILAPYWLTFIDEQGTAGQSLIFFFSLALWLFAAFRFWQIWRVTRSRVDGALAFAAFWLAHAVVSMHQFPVWQLSWWLYHFLLCFGFLITVYVLVTEYEQARQFRLLHYYLGVALIGTATLALLASYLFAEFSYRTLVNRIETSTAVLLNSVTQAVADSIPADATPELWRSSYAARLDDLSLGNLILYDANGRVFYPNDPSGMEDEAANALDQQEFEQALAGETLVEVRKPGEASGYNPFGSVYTVEAYAPLPSAPGAPPVGVLVALQAAPELGQAVLRARATGLIVSALTMGLLFLFLLAVVMRADRIITARTEELVRAYTSLRQAESMRDDLSNMIIHDLRNPLNVISATIELMEAVGHDGRLGVLDRFWESVYGATQRMMGLIEDILSVNKIEAGELTPRFVSTSLAELLGDRLRSFKPQATIESKHLILECPPELTAELDPELMGRVVENLIANAFKYTDHSGLIQISAQAEDGILRLSVRDDGDGIPDHYKQRIFEKFAQVPSSNGHAIRKGIGLGLAFCNLVVQAHGGQIGVIDAPGGGSEFVVRLPQRHNGSPLT